MEYLYYAIFMVGFLVLAHYSNQIRILRKDNGALLSCVKQVQQDVRQALEQRDLDVGYARVKLNQIDTHVAHIMGIVTDPTR